MTRLPKKLGGKKAKALPVFFYDSLDTLIRDFVFIHGTDVAYDCVNRMMVKVAHLRLSYGNEAVKSWLMAPGRRVVNKQCVVFDPARSVDPGMHLNLFDGLECQPKPGSCTKLLELLVHLCSGDERISNWILCWCALPLQSLGTKLPTSIVMHGAEGTGKNLFWSALMAIYGHYATMIGQSQLEGDFNGWASGKIFVVCNEVVSRRERWEIKGKLKHMISESLIHINEKGIPEREEANHANFVFLSNEVQPLALGRGDRRFLVVECWKLHPRGREFYAEVQAELDNGGVEAFMDHLLKLPLGEFDAHTKPLETDAKNELVQLGKNEAERFIELWCADETLYPPGAALFEDLYPAFKRWCATQGERHVPSMVIFGRIAKTMLGCKAGERLYSGPPAPPEGKRPPWPDVKQRTVYWDTSKVPEFPARLPGKGRNDPPREFADLGAWLFEHCRAFRMRNEAEEGAFDT